MEQQDGQSDSERFMPVNERTATSSFIFGLQLVVVVVILASAQQQVGIPPGW